MACRPLYTNAVNRASLTLPEPVRTVLSQHTVLHLAVHTEHGPHSAPVFFAVAGDRLTWISNPTTLHARSAEAGNRVSASVSPAAPPMQSFRGVQVRGWVDTPAKEQAALRTAFLQRHPGAAPFVEAADAHRFYALHATWIRLIERNHHNIRRTTWP
jgi:uncharacterized protein YhbP (UPF0306 family)